MAGKKGPKSAKANAEQLLPESNRILQNLVDVAKGKKHTPKATNPHPVHGKKPKKGSNK